MRGYGQFCPVAKAAEILAERWTPLVLRELISGSHRFNDLHRGVPLMSRSLMAQRLRSLEAAGIVQRRPSADGAGVDYYLTSAGEEFRPVIEAMGCWGQRWSRRFDTADLDPGLLVWDMQRNLIRKHLPPRRVVVQLEFRGVPRRHNARSRWWMILEPQAIDVCLKYPGFDVELNVRADLVAMTKVWMGDLPLIDALRSGAVALDGKRQLVRAFSSWLGLSTFASVPRPPQMASATHAG